jgi:hypothetical protein
MTCTGWSSSRTQAPTVAVAVPLRRSHLFPLSHYGTRCPRLVHVADSGISNATASIAVSQHRSRSVPVHARPSDRHTLPFKIASNSLKTLTRASARSTQFRTVSVDRSYRT